MVVKCNKCSEDMPQKRRDLGYRNCVNCSDEPRWSSVPVINHKTGNEIQIVKDPEVAAEFMAKSARTGFGTLRGMSSGYKRPRPVSMEKPKALPDKPLVDRVISRKPLPHKFEEVGAAVMDLLEAGKTKAAYEYIERSLEEKQIYRVHAEQLRKIVETLT